MSDGNLNACITADNTTIDVVFGAVYEVDRGISNAIIADKYDKTQTYAVGDYVIHSKKLYRCITVIEIPEEFNSEKWLEVRLAEEVEAISNAMAGKADADSVYTKTETDTLLDDKMDKTNPVGTGSFSFNRREGSTVGTNSATMGANTVASGNYSFSAGYGSAANGMYSVAMGNGAAATGTSSNASGYLTTASGNSSHAEGRETTASGTYSHAEGQESISSGNYGSHAEGYKTTAGGDSSHSEGDRTKANGENSHAEGAHTTASNTCSHAEGSTTTASGVNAHAEGYNTTASGDNSHSEGYETIASGYVAHAEGYSTTASAIESHAEGYSTIASNQGAHAEGGFTKASGTYSHAEGNYTEANHKSQHVFGEYNVLDDSQESASQRGNYIEVVGNGSSNYERSNARTLDWRGNEVLAGDLTYNGNKSITSEVQRLDNKIDSLPAPMVFKGTLGVNGTIQVLPIAYVGNEGWTYRVITNGTYDGQVARVGDVFTSNGFAWIYIPSGDDDVYTKAQADAKFATKNEIKDTTIDGTLYHLGFYLDANGGLCQVNSI